MTEPKHVSETQTYRRQGALHAPSGGSQTANHTNMTRAQTRL